MSTSPERDASLNATYVAVAASGALGLACALAFFSLRTASAVAVGVVLSLANLWTLETLVRAYLRSAKGRWTVLALAKAAVLFVAVALLVRGGVVDVLPLVFGFGALPTGVVVGGAWPVRTASEEN
jgi:hypothetical protein